MDLKQLIQALPVLQVEGSTSKPVTGLAYDSRQVTPGAVFVALPGSNVDGHDFIAAAIDRGASAIVCERNGFSSSRATKIKVPDAREAMALLAAQYHGHPATRLKVVGVTGTNGKTTVAFMVKSILEAAGLKCGLLGTVRYEIGDRIIPAHRTTPESLEVQQMMAQMLRAGCQACVMEVSSHALEQKRVLGIEFDVALFTNLTQDHLDYHGTMDNYFAAKKKLFQAPKSGAKKSSAVINIDDAYGQRLVRESDLAVQLTYALNHPAEVRATQTVLSKDGSRFQLQFAGQAFECRLPLVGRHNVYNALAAAGAALAMDVSAAQVQSALNRMEPVPGRLENIDLGQPFAVLVDYAHTDDALRNVLGTLRELTPGRLLLAFGCGGSRDTGKRAKMGRAAAELADFSLITSDNPRKEPPQKIAAQVEEGYRSVRADGYRLELDRRRAIDDLIRLALPGDTVLIAGKGHETYQEFEDTVVPFDDRVYARETLETLGHGRKNRRG